MLATKDIIYSALRILYSINRSIFFMNGEEKKSFVEIPAAQFLNSLDRIIAVPKRIKSGWNWTCTSDLDSKPVKASPKRVFMKLWLLSMTGLSVQLHLFLWVWIGKGLLEFQLPYRPHLFHNVKWGVSRHDHVCTN